MSTIQSIEMPPPVVPPSTPLDAYSIVKDIVTALLAIAALWISFRMFRVAKVALNTWRQQLVGTKNFDLAAQIVGAAVRLKYQCQKLEDAESIKNGLLTETVDRSSLTDDELEERDKHLFKSAEAVIEAREGIDDLRIALETLLAEGRARWPELALDISKIAVDFHAIDPFLDGLWVFTPDEEREEIKERDAMWFTKPEGRRAYFQPRRVPSPILIPHFANVYTVLDRVIDQMRPHLIASPMSTGGKIKE
jgi:hypothetical protein